MRVVDFFRQKRQFKFADNNLDITLLDTSTVLKKYPPKNLCAKKVEILGKMDFWLQL